MRHTDRPVEPLAGAAGFRFAIIVSRFNEAITERLRDGACGALAEAGAGPGDVDVMVVPGAFELPQAAQYAAESGRFDAIVCLGCVIRGATPHFEYISSAVAHGIMTASVRTGTPIAFGVLTTDTPEQAEERSSDRDNKGREAAVAALEMAMLFRRLGRAPARGGGLRPFGFEPGRPTERSDGDT